jgi:hypothetical protein
MNCTDLTANITAALCGKVAVSGTGAKVVLINYEDIDRILSTEVANVITSLKLNGTKKGVLFTSHEDSTVGDVSLKKGTYVDTFVHNLNLRIFVKNEDTKKFVNDLAMAKIVAVVENKELGNAGDVKYEVYGWNSGLEASEITGTTELADGIVYNVKIGTSDKSTEGTLPKSFFVTDAAATKLAFDALYAVA